MPLSSVHRGKALASLGKGRLTPVLTPGGGVPPPFTPPAPPPVGGYTDWYESRQINLSPPYNPADAGDISEWFSLSDSNSLTTGGTPGSYAISGLNGLPVVTLNTRELDGNESFTGGSMSLVFVANSGIIRLSSSGDNFEVAAGPGNFTINFQGSPILTGPAVDSQFHVHCITYDSVLFILRWWMDGVLVGVAGSLTALALLNGPLSFNDTFVFAFVGYDFALSPTQVNSVCRWYGGTGTGAPATGITVATYAQAVTYWPGCVANFDGDAGSSGAAWPDPISGGATQATPGSQPTFQTGVAGINGHDCYLFDGVNDFFNVTTPFYPDTEWTVFHVLKKGASGTVLTGLMSTSNFGPFSLLAYINDNVYVNDKNSQSQVADAATSWALWTTQNDNSVLTIRKNGVNQSLSNTPLGLIPSLWGVIGSWPGVGAPGNGQIARIVAYNQAFSPTIEAEIEAFLNSEYAVF